VNRLLTILLLLWAFASSASAQTTDRAAIDRAINAVWPSLVRISVVVIESRDGREVNLEGSGSGTIISADGYVVTNHHVAGRARRIICTLADKQEVPADLVGTDPLSDITVLKLRPPTPRTFPAAKFGDSALLRRGDQVLAMGSPRALSQSVTLGVASNTEMTMPGRSTLDLDGEDVGSIVRWIGHDAAIYPGNSGGPLVNLEGEIIGVNEISLGLSGAIPGNLAKQVTDAIIRDGRVRRSWPGIEVQPTVGGHARGGALVSWVASGSPAAAAGLRPGDVLLKVNDVATDAQFAEQVPLVNQVLFGLRVGEAAKFTVVRAAKEMTFTVTPIERPAALSTPRELRTWGIVASNLTAFEARGLGREATTGVRVVSLRTGGPMEQARPALARDDVIVEVEGKPVASVNDLEALGSSGAGRGMLVTFERGRERRITIVTPSSGARASDSPPAEARKAWVPVTVQVLTPPLAERMGLAGRTGVRVTQVYDPALPLRVGDIILAIDGQPVRASAPTDEEVFAAAIRRVPIGATVPLTVSRDGRQITVPVTLPAAPPLAREMKRYEDEDFGFRARDLADADRYDPRLDRETTGVLVDSVANGSWASLARLSAGDVIMSIDGRDVADVDDLAARLKEIRASRPSSVVVFVRRGVKSLFLDLQPAWR
jgi:serine protease Do